MLFQSYQTALGPGNLQAYLTMTSLAVQGLLGDQSQVFWVNAAHPRASTAGGRPPEVPASTLNAALGLCTAGRGDVIVLSPEHTENLNATSVTMVAGVSVIGSTGPKQPQISFTGTDDTNTILIGDNVDGVLIRGVKFRVTNAALDALITISSATGVTIEDCSFFGNSTTVNVDTYLKVASGTDLTVRRCRFYGSSSTNNCVAAIQFTGAASRTVLEDNIFIGLFSSAAILSDASISPALFTFVRNQIFNLHATGTAITLTNNAAGVIGQINANYVNSTPSAVATRGGISVGATATVALNENYGHDSVGADQGVLNPAADS